MWLKCCLLGVLTLTFLLTTAEAWRGHVCTRRVCRYTWVRVCRYRFWGWCCAYKWVQQGYWVTEQFCCHGWKHNGDKNCNLPICIPKCLNQGICSDPGKCTCRTTHTGYRCGTAVCSYRSPCFPGTCTSSDNCDCSSGFSTALPLNKQDYCLKIDDDANTDLRMTEMQVRLSYWPRYAQPPMELHWIMADSTDLGDMDVMWTNRRDFNRLETTSTSQYFPPELTDLPPYVSKAEFGIVAGSIEVWLKKLNPGGVGYDATFTSLKKNISCDQFVDSTHPESSVYNCSIVDPNFDRFLEHRDVLKVTFKSKGGGYRNVKNTDTGYPHRTQPYLPVSREISVEFRFDFILPTHCEITSTCSGGEKMLSVPDLTRSNSITITWDGWQDEDSKMNRYAWEVFSMSKVNQGLEIPPSRVLSPLTNQEVMAANYTPQTYRLPAPGMYSVILEAGDLANNTIYVRRLVLYDPDPRVTTDPDHDLFVSTASEAAGYKYQSDFNGGIIVTWDRHFRNAFHEENNLLGSVRRYPPELRDGNITVGNKTEGFPRFRKDIPPGTVREDHEGKITVNAIPNKRGIVSFALQHHKDNQGGVNQPQTPTGTWTDMGLNTTFMVPETPSDGLTVTVWVKATDVMDSDLVERTQVTFDSTPPSVVGGIQFLMNQHVPGVDFSSQFTVQTSDHVSGIAYILWTFTRLSNNSVIYQERVEGVSAPFGCDFTECSCTKSRECFSYTQTFSVSNCRMMVEKENLATEVINVTADITNMAGLVTHVSMTKDNLTKLNGTEAYFPPQNITVTEITKDSVTLTWSYPPSCFPRTAVWVIVNGERRPVHKDATKFSVTGLEPGTSYTISMVTDFTGDVRSDKASVQFFTEEDPFPVGAIIGIVIAFLIIALIVIIIVIFVLWRRGKVFQKEGTPVNRQLHRMSRAIDNVRKTVRGHRSDAAFQNHAYRADGDQEDIYLYAPSTFSQPHPWHLQPSAITLLDHVGEGRFATIYKATWTHGNKQDTVAAKMLKAGFTQEDVEKMRAKIDFMVTKLDKHPNVIQFLGAVLSNDDWGPVLVMEYCEMGQMDRWLVQNRGTMSEQVMENLLRFGHGVARGMEYIASKGITHKRLAARNVLLSFLLEPKVAGFGPQQKEGEEEKATRVPAKWSAPEVLQERPSTEKSDVWSYGIVLWEIFSMGQVPYPGIHAGEIGSRLKSGYRMDKPEFADDMHYGLMKDCWQYKESKRPTFKTIRAQLDKLFSSGNRQSVDFYYDTNQLNG
ncbi:uncharacterized protein LOC143277811 [Babylonia areolata]|uniref:uncharacterized protein LOC143277811 n=1 Tax=Babylonia areolata TaxID=304850 RepID=UPI003FD1FDE4